MGTSQPFQEMCLTTIYSCIPSFSSVNMMEGCRRCKSPSLRKLLSPYCAMSPKMSELSFFTISNSQGPVTSSIYNTTTASSTAFALLPSQALKAVSNTCYTAVAIYS